MRNKDSQAISKRVSDISKWSEVEIIGYALRRDESIECEIRLHNDSKASDLIRKLNLGVRDANFMRQNFT